MVNKLKDIRITSEIISNIKKVMKDKHITQEDIANKLKISRGTVNNLLNEKTFNKKNIEEIYKYVTGNTYSDINLLEVFSKKDLLEELLKREKNNYEI